MRRGSSCTIEIDTPNLVDSEITKVYIVANQKGFTLKKEATLSDGKAKVSYDAKETKEFAPGVLFLQMIAETKKGDTFQSDIVRYNISDTLDKGEMKNAYSYNGFNIRYPY